MDLLSPIWLLLLLALPVLVAIRIWVNRRHRPAVRYSSLSLVREALPRSSRIRRHLPFALFLLALGSLAVAMARPAAIVAVPDGQTTVILTIDVSRSMCSTDVAPNRLLAAEAAATDFINSQPSTTRIGIVAFAGFAELVQAPTTDREVLLDVIGTLATGRRTAIGSAILESIDAISEIDPNVPKSTTASTPPNLAPAPVAPGAYASAIIVLLTDGASNAGPDPIDAAQQAANRGLKVYTIGFGTSNPGSRNPTCGQQFIGGEPGDSFGPGLGGGFGGGFGGGGGGAPAGGFRGDIDEQTLTQIADTTGAKYFPAETADQLKQVLQNLPTNTIVKHQVTELSVVFVAIGALFATMAIFLGQAWRPSP
jgi:Ca-activated chloride channel family protein